MIKRKNWMDNIWHLKLRTKLFLIILVSGIFCIFMFRFLWTKKWEAWYFLLNILPENQQILPKPADDFWNHLVKDAKKYNVPDSEISEDSEEIEDYFSFVDEYTGLYIYGLEDGLYRVGKIPEKIADTSFGIFFNMGYRWTEGSGTQVFDRSVQFKNGYAHVIVYFYHSSYFIYPFFIFSLSLSVCLFFFIILFFVGKKIRIIVRLENNILQMSTGDLITPVPGAGRDELGILSLELDKLRATLYENILHEQEIHKSSQELLAALSHDLRTPLTILKGYLDIIHLNRNPDMQTEYISRCIQKADDIQEMTGRMFEYALVYHETNDKMDDAVFSELPLDFFFDVLKEHADFLRLAGFDTDLQFSDITTDFSSSGKDFFVTADAAMLKRVFNNLFSNIIKYGAKNESVVISVSYDTTLTILIKNRMKTKHTDMDKPTKHPQMPSGSTQIGLKSAQKIMERMNGTLRVQTEKGFFTAELNFPSGIYY